MMFDHLIPRPIFSGNESSTPLQYWAGSVLVGGMVYTLRCHQNTEIGNPPNSTEAYSWENMEPNGGFSSTPSSITWGYCGCIM